VALFVACFLMGILAVPAGIGGGTLFVPIIGGFFPFHLDFVRGAGLLVALAIALSAGPMLLRGGLASLRLALPLALLASASSIGGAMLGLALPAPAVQIALGVIVLGIVALMFMAGKSEFPKVERSECCLGAAPERRVHRPRRGPAIDCRCTTPLAWHVFADRRAGRHVRPRRRLGQCAGAQPAAGRARVAAGTSGGLVAGRFVRLVGLPASRRRT
jgi:uncharacterized membrane protein YfcA